MSTHLYERVLVNNASASIYAEAFVRKANETHALLPVTDYAMGFDNLTSHRSYSTLCVRDLIAE